MGHVKVKVKTDTGSAVRSGGCEGGEGERSEGGGMLPVGRGQRPGDWWQLLGRKIEADI